MNENDSSRSVVALERIGKVLGALYASHLGDLDQKLKAVRLHRCGFSNSDIADVLGTTSNTVNVALYHARKGRKKRKKQKTR